MIVQSTIDIRLLGNPRAVAMAVRGLLDGVVLINQLLMYQYAFPRLIESKIRFRREPTEGTGLEEFATCDEVLKRGWGDCDDLAPYLCAELRGTRGLEPLVPKRLQRGEDASIRVHRRPDNRQYHVLVRRGNGDIIDPSRYLGM